MTAILETQLREFYQLLNHEGYYTQCHAQDVKANKIIDRRLVKGADALVEWAKRWNGKGNLFIGRNPRNEKGQIEKITAISFDIDPVRPKGEASTRQQLQAAINAAKRLRVHLAAGQIYSSGNGALLVVAAPEKTEIKDIKAFENGTKAIEEEARKIVEGDAQGGEPAVRLDSTFDAARLVKLAGTISTKGSEDNWRYAQLVHRDGGGRQASARLFERVINVPPAVEHLQLVERGDIDRSKEDFAMAARFKAQGFSAGECLTAMCKYGLRGREDDYQRIVNKLYGASSESSLPGRGGTEGGDERSSDDDLWHPGKLDEYIEHLQERGKRREPELPYGFPTLDEPTFGLKRGDVSIVGAYTGVGKTSLLLNIAWTVLQRDKSVLIFTTEMAREDVLDRLVSIITGVPAESITTGRLTEKDQQRIRDGLKQIEQRNLSISDSAQPSIRVIANKVARIRPDVLVFDHVQHSADGSEDRHREISRFIKGFHQICKEHNCAGLVASQLNRSAKFEADTLGNPPSLRHLAESGSLEQEAAVVVLLSQPSPSSLQVMAEMAKNRYGRKATATLEFHASSCRFEEA